MKRLIFASLTAFFILGQTHAHANTQYTVLADYSVFEMWVLNKYGLTAAYRADQSSQWEVEWMRGSVRAGKFGIDIGGVGEQRLTASWRSFGERKSFSFIVGAYYDELEVSIGSKYLQSIPGGRVELLRLRTLGLSGGLGNRWQTPGGFTWGIDWITLNVPVISLEKNAAFVERTNNPEYRERVNDAIDWFQRFPTLGVLKVQAGYSW